MTAARSRARDVGARAGLTLIKAAWEVRPHGYLPLPERIRP